MTSDKLGIRVPVGVGDPIFHGRDTSPIGMIRSTEPKSATTTRARGIKPVRMLFGQPLPGSGDLVYCGAVLVRTQ